MNKLKFVLLLFNIVFLSLVAFAADEPTVEEFKKIIITADDGTKMVLRCNYAPEGILPLGIGLSKNDAKKIMPYALMCEHEIHVLYAFYHWRDWFDVDIEKKINVKKARDFQSAITYNVFVLPYSGPDGHPKGVSGAIYWEFTVRDNIQNWILAWVDKENDKYCGSLARKLSGGYNSFVTDEECMDYYVHTKDIYLHEVNDFLESYKKILQKRDIAQIDGTNVSMDSHSSPALNSIISQYDKEEYNALTSEYQRLMPIYDEFRMLYYNKCRLELYLSFTKSEIKKVIDKDRYLKNKELPNIEGELPVNEDELVIYRNYIPEISYSSKNDIYGTLARYELLEDIGIKVTSAGADKIFDTDDDIWIIKHFDGSFELYNLDNVIAKIREKIGD